MKKKILLVTILFLCVYRLFAVEYIYWEDSKEQGNVTAHVKLCFPKGFNDKQYANKELNRIMQTQFDYNKNGLKDYVFFIRSLTCHVTEVRLNNGSRYRIILYDLLGKEYDIQFVNCVNYSNSWKEGNPMEVIYKKNYYNFNSAYSEYESLCNKYLEYM